MVLTVQGRGLKEKLLAFANGINAGEWPIQWWQQLQISRIGPSVEQEFNFNVLVPQ